MAGAGEDLELLFHAEKTNFLSRNDALVVALHSFLLDDGSRCVGKGEEWPGEDVKGSKTLPHSWNDTQDKISLRYVKGDKPIIKTVLSVFADRDNTMITIKDMALQKSEGICLDVGAYVNPEYETFESTYKNLDELRKRLKDEVLKPLVKLREKKEDEEREKNRYRSRFHDYDDDFHYSVPSGTGNPPFGMAASRPSPFDYGRSDLDPFGAGRRGPGGGGQGGMLFEVPRPNRNPPIPGNFPGGSVPPGARFDPIGPFGPNAGMPRPSPDPDVGLPPPGYDDMFG